MIVDDYVVGEPSALEQESGILKAIKAANLKNPKKLVKFVTKLYSECEWDIQKMFCLQIIEAKDPVGYVDLCIRRIEDCAVIMENMVEESNHGMMFVGANGDTVLPIRLNTMEKWLTEMGKWHPDDEFEIGRDAADAYYEQHPNVPGPIKLVLFPQFGFTGIPRYFVRR